MNRINVAKLVGAIFLAIGLLMLAIGGFLTTRTLSWADAETTTGIVVEHHYHAPDRDRDGNRDGPTWSFTVEWTDAQGGVHQTRSGYSSSNPPAIGSEVPIEYYPDDPGRSRVADWSGRWLAAAIVGGLGVGFGLIGGVLLFVSRREPFRLPGPMPMPDPTTPTDNYHGPVDPPAGPDEGWQQPER